MPTPSCGARTADQIFLSIRGSARSPKSLRAPATPSVTIKQAKGARAEYLASPWTRRGTPADLALAVVTDPDSHPEPTGPPHL
jgi:hypothetical protein